MRQVELLPNPKDADYNRAFRSNAHAIIRSLTGHSDNVYWRMESTRFTLDNADDYCLYFLA